MPISDLVPFSRGRSSLAGRQDDDPFRMLHRQMNRLFDDAWRDFDLAPFGRQNGSPQRVWPSIEVDETDKELKVIAELPGLDERDVQVELSNGVLTIKGEKKIETEDKERKFSERSYGYFERRVPIEDVDEEKISANFKNGVLTVAMPKSSKAQSKVRKIAIGK